ncbi:ScyD/ScyE family protein [Flavitalea sp.]|nr:ScyD/ScyE family protein [Flavitalea sp.]
MKKFIVDSRNFMLLAFCFAIVVPGCKKGDIPHDVPLSAKLLVTGLKELQGSTVGPDKALYVTAPLDGTIWRVDPKTGDYTPFTTGLPKRVPDPFYIGSGVVDVAFRGKTAYALVTGVAPDLDGKDIVGIYRVDGPGSFTIMADIGAWSIAHPPVPAFFVPTGFQYAFEPYKDGFIVTDGHHNRVLYVKLDGNISEVVAFADVVPTGLAVRDNAIYLTQAGPIPHEPEQAKLISLSPKAPTPRELASAAGLEVGLFVDVEFGPGNNLYALAQGIWDGPFEGAPALPNTGALLLLKPDDTFGVIKDGLNQPTSMEFIGNKAYVVSLAGEVWEINHVSSSPYGY